MEKAAFVTVAHKPGELRAEVLKQAKIELKMNLSLMKMLKGDTPLKMLVNPSER